MSKSKSDKKKKKLEKKLYRNINRYHKEKEQASIELFLLLNLYSKKFPRINRRDAYHNVLSSLKTNEKNLNHSGASLYPVTFLIGIILFFVNNTFFNELNPNGILTQVKELLNLLNAANSNVGEYVLLYGIILFVFMLFFLPIAGLISLIVYLFDKPSRKKITKNSIMIELLNEKIENLDLETSNH